MAVQVVGPVFSILCYSVAGFFLYIVMVLSFVNAVPLAAKYTLIGVFAAIALVGLLLGLLATVFARWQRDVGVVFVSAALFTAFLAITFACLWSSPEFAELVPDHQREFFSDYLAGCSSILIFLALGSILLWQHNRSNPTESGEAK